MNQATIWFSITLYNICFQLSIGELSQAREDLFMTLSHLEILYLPSCVDELKRDFFLYGTATLQKIDGSLQDYSDPVR